MKSEVLSKALGRPVNLHHERIEDIVIELVKKVEEQKEVFENIKELSKYDGESIYLDKVYVIARNVLEGQHGK
jgi:HEPN domain-containing protein